MSNDLKILITANLNTGASIGEINTAISGIEKKINSLKLNIELNDKIFTTLNKFTDQMKRISDAALNTGKVIEEALMPDGTKVKRTYFDGLKGEFAETIKAAKESSKSQLASLDEVASGYDKVIKQVEKYNAAQKKVGETLTISDANGINTRTINANAQGQVTSYKDTTNQQKQDKLDEQAIKDQQKLIEQMEQFRLQSLQRVQQRNLEWNTSQQQAIQRNGDLERQEIARTQASRESYENWWAQAMSTQEQRQRQVNENLTNQISNYQRAAEIQANALSSNPNKMLSSEQQTSLQNYLNSVRELNVQTPQVQQRMRELALDFREISSQATAAHDHSLSFGNALKQAFEKFPVWMVATTAFYAPLHALEDMSSRLIQIDTQMTEIDRILGGMNKLQLNDLLQTAIDESDQLKNKLSDTLDIMAEFATMGYKSEDLGNLSKVAQIMTNISGLDAKSAVDSLVSAMVNFNIQTKDAMSIEDKFSKVDQNFAVTTLDLAQGIQKAGASAKTFGVDIDSLNGYITAIAQSTRESGSVIGKELLI